MFYTLPFKYRRVLATSTKEQCTSIAEHPSPSSSSVLQRSAIEISIGLENGAI